MRESPPPPPRCPPNRIYAVLPVPFTPPHHFPSLSDPLMKYKPRRICLDFCHDRPPFAPARRHSFSPMFFHFLASLTVSLRLQLCIYVLAAPLLARQLSLLPSICERFLLIARRFASFVLSPFRTRFFDCRIDMSTFLRTWDGLFAKLIARPDSTSST